MGNLDFGNNAGFSWYCVLLLISGIAMLCTTGVPGVSGGARIATVLFGLGFVVYALYLIFIFDGTRYFIFFKAFIVPVVVIAGAIKSATERRKAARQPAFTAQPPAGMPGQYGQPPQYGQPQYGQPAPYGQVPVNGGYQPAASAEAPTVAVPAQAPAPADPAFAPTVAVPMPQQPPATAQAPQGYPQQP